MARIVDITEKLNFEEPPALKIKGVDIPINNKAVDVLRITPLLQKGEDLSVEDFNTLYETIFPPESREKIESLENLTIKGFNTIVWEGAKLIAGAEDDEGEDQTPATT